MRISCREQAVPGTKKRVATFASEGEMAGRARGWPPQALPGRREKGREQALLVRIVRRDQRGEQREERDQRDDRKAEQDAAGAHPGRAVR